MIRFLALALLAVMSLPTGALASQVGQPAPDFSAPDLEGKPFTLSEQKGKIVVLEWTNHECPFVVKHYATGNMQKTQKTALDQGVVWVSINSSAPGRQGHTDAAQAKQIAQQEGSNFTAKILDETGTIGKLYGAQTTPHMFVIDAQGKLVYAGAIDSNPSPSHDTIEGATNYVLAAIENLKANQPVKMAQSQPYGCAVKYAG